MASRLDADELLKKSPVGEYADGTLHTTTDDDAEVVFASLENAGFTVLPL